MNVKKIDKRYDFDLLKPSYIGKPLNNTFMFISKKVEGLLINLEGVSNCLIFAENGIVVDEKYQAKNCFIFTDTPQLTYTKFALLFKEEKDSANRKRLYKELNGSLIGENVTIGKNTFIEPGCLIDHDVVIGDNCTILAKTIIRNSVIGNNVLINENALIGANAFNMTVDDNGNKMRMPTLGNVVIGNNVEIGAFDNISCGLAGTTIIEDYAKLDAYVHIGHDVIIRKNAEITAGCVFGGFVELGENSYMGLSSVIKNRITIGENAFIGMGAAVMKHVDDDVMVLGNPARPLPKERN